MLKHLLLIAPKLIEQPTWGGRYIIEQKKWTNKKLFQNLKIGQSYELFSDIKVRRDLNSSKHPDFSGELGYANDPNKVIYNGDSSKLLLLKSLIKNQPEKYLGKTAFKKHGSQIKILIKFTQAKGNSFQLHVKDDAGKWLAKPESWYFLEPGYITLGVKDNIRWDKYQKTIENVDRFLKDISLKLKNNKISYEKAKENIETFLKKNSPWNYVNKLTVKKDTLIDLSSGGIHHSWEEDDSKFPLGNIVYELCLDIMDPKSSIRLFDKGKIGKDGSLRETHLKDYFKYIDRSKKANDPKSHILKPKGNNLLSCPYYSMDKIILFSDFQEKLSGSYHHLFVTKGEIEVKTSEDSLTLTQGHSCFIPAYVTAYKLIPKIKSEILKTYVS